MPGLIKTAKWFDELADYIQKRRTHDTGQIDRAERMLKDMPHTVDIYSPEAVGEKFAFAPEKEMVGLLPREFLRLAHPLPESHARPYVDTYKDLLLTREFNPKPGLFNQHYIDRMRNQEFKGFSDVPFLQMERTPRPRQVKGHEGRHRSLVLKELYGPDTPQLTHLMNSNPDVSRIYAENDPMGEFPVRLRSNMERYAEGGMVDDSQTDPDLDYSTIMGGQRRDPELSRRGARAIRDAFSYVTPTSPEDAALSALLGPFGRPAKLASTAALAATYSPETEASIIAGGKRVADLLGIRSVLDRAVDMFNSGKSQSALAHESVRALNAMRNPGQARSVYIGPEGIPRVVIGNENSFIPRNAPFKEMQGNYRYPSKMENKMQENESVMLSDILHHPSIFDLSPSLANIKVKNNPLLTLFGGRGSYNPSTNEIGLSGWLPADSRISNDPRGALQQVLLHEANHALQAEAGVRGGTNLSSRALREGLDEAERKGSYNPHRLAGYNSILDRIDSGELKGDPLERRLFDMYRRNYGEAEARAGSEYVPTALPHLYLGETW